MGRCWLTKTSLIPTVYTSYFYFADFRKCCKENERHNLTSHTNYKWCIFNCEGYTYRYTVRRLVLISSTYFWEHQCLENAFLFEWGQVCQFDVRGMCFLHTLQADFKKNVNVKRQQDKQKKDGMWIYMRVISFFDGAMLLLYICGCRLSALLDA